MPFDTTKDFTPVSLLARAPLVLVVAPDLPVRGTQELIALAKSKPGSLSAASSGNGGAGHLTLELFRARTGADIVHVPYKGTQPALVDLMAGRVQLMFDGVTTSKEHIKAGKLRGLMMAGPASPLLPGVPSAADAGLPGFESMGWLGAMFVPAGTPAPIVERLHAEFSWAVNLPEVRERFASLGLEPLANSPEQFSALLQTESQKWAKIIREANIRLD
jgi:tripartite-type tricarboxylate transporter receptor subunit TctC